MQEIPVRNVENINHTNKVDSIHHTGKFKNIDDQNDFSLHRSEI